MYEKWFEIEHNHAVAGFRFVMLEDIDPKLAEFALKDWEEKAAKATRFLYRAEARLSEVDMLIHYRFDELTEEEKRLPLPEESLAQRQAQRGDGDRGLIDRVLYNAIDEILWSNIE